MNWTQEQRDELVALWDCGRRSYAQLAEHFKTTKGSVVSRMRREKRIRGLKVEDRYAHPSKFPKQKPTSKPRTRRKPMQESMPLLAVPDLSRVASIVEVTGCRWAVGHDPDIPGGHLFCNHETEAKASYCPYHARENIASYSADLIRKTTRDAVYAYYKRAA